MKRLALILPLLISAYVPSAYGYGWLSASCGTLDFNSGHMTFNLTNSLTTAQKTAIELGTDRVTLYSDSSITLNDNNDSSYSSGNGQNEVYRDYSHSTAYCSYWYNTGTCDVTEADIAFGDEPWQTTDGYNSYVFGVSGRSMTGTAVHEGGHCVGMAHENRYYNMMGADFEHLTWSGGEAFYGPGEDMSNGLINLHGKRSTDDTYRDVGVTVMRYSYASGEYSRHASGVLRDTSGVQLPVVGSFADQPLYQVNGGQQVRMELTLENNGEQNSESPSLGFYLSTNDIISTGDTNVGSGNPALGRGLPYETYYTITIPSSTIAGDLFLGAYIDDDGVIPEYTLSNNLNNFAFYPIRVVGADLIVSAFSRSATEVLPSGSLTLYGTVRNQGIAGSAATTLRYYRSTNSIISTGDTQVCTDSVPSLSPNGTSAQNCTVTVPSTPGTYYFGACVDSVAGESNAANQCSSGYAVTVGRPDLLISSFSRSPTSLLPGGILSMSATVQNLGTISSPATTLRYYRSTNSIISTGDTEVCTADYVAALAVGGTSNESCAFSVTTTPGTYYYGVCVDAVTGESNTSNQCSAGYAVVVGRPDLVISAFSRTPSVVYVGGNLSMSATVTNQGTLSSAATTLRYYRSTNSIISTGDTQVCTDAVAALGPGGTSPEGCTVTLLTPGNYYFGVCVDSVSGETSTGNNCSAGLLVTISDASASCSGVDVTISNTLHTATGLVCEGTNSLTSGPNVTVSSTASVTYRSPAIRLYDFSVGLGGTFRAVTP